MDLEWRLRAVMAERGVERAKDLYDALAAVGLRLTASQVDRLCNGTPERVSLTVVAALCDVLDCTPNDLLAPSDDPWPGPAARTHLRVVPPGDWG